MAAQLNPLGGLPPHIQQFVMQMMGQPDEDPFAADLEALHQQVLQAQGGARDAQSQLQGLQQKPIPQTSPGTDALTELFGGLSQLLAPELGGLQQARGAKEGIQEDMQKRRSSRLQTMEKHYDELAERADRLGNTELSLKMRAKADALAAKQKRDAEARDLGSQMYEGEQNRNAAMARTRVSEAGATERAHIGQNTQLMRYGLRQNPDGSIAEVSPIVTRKDWQAREATLVNSIIRGKKDKINVEGLESSLRDHYTKRVEDERGNPALYAKRLSSYKGTEQGFKVLGFGGKKGEAPFTPEEVAQQIVLQYGADPDTKEGRDVIFDALRRGMLLSREAAATVVQKLYGASSQ